MFSYLQEYDFERIMEQDIETAYLSGPMSGIEDFNFPEFNRYAEALRELGFVIINPAETAGGVDHMSREWYFQIDFANILACDAVFLMPGWDESEGAKAEIIYATQLGKPVFVMQPNGVWLLNGVKSRVSFFLTTPDLHND